MDERIDVLLADRLRALQLEGEPDWADVGRRARRRGRRRALGVVAVAVALLAVAPALGLHRVVIDFFEADAAPESVQLDFARQELGAPEGMAPGAIAGETRRIDVAQADGMSTFVWVAPTRAGGFCTMWEHHVGGCRDRDQTVGGPIGAGWSDTRTPQGEMVGRIYGSVPADAGDTLVLEFADTTTVDLPVTWVSAPINAGFFSYPVPQDHLSDSTRPIALVLYHGDDAVGRLDFPVSSPLDAMAPGTGLPLAVVYERRVAVITITTESGKTVSLYTAPSRDIRAGRQGTCAWLSTAGGPMYRAFFGCREKKLQSTDPALGIGISGGAPVLVSGLVGASVRELELRFKDGSVERVRPVDGYILAEIGREHYPPARRLYEIVGLDSAGKEVDVQKLGSDGGLYPCDPSALIDLGLGVKRCP